MGPLMDWRYRECEYERRECSSQPCVVSAWRLAAVDALLLLGTMIRGTAGSPENAGHSRTSLRSLNSWSAPRGKACRNSEEGVVRRVEGEPWNGINITFSIEGR
jgi:hypothetical protein